MISNTEMQEIHDSHQSIEQKGCQSCSVLTQCVRSQQAAKERAGAFDSGRKSSQFEAPGSGIQLLVLEEEDMVTRM